MAYGVENMAQKSMVNRVACEKMVKVACEPISRQSSEPVNPGARGFGIFFRKHGEKKLYVRLTEQERTKLRWDCMGLLGLCQKLSPRSAHDEDFINRLTAALFTLGKRKVPEGDLTAIKRLIEKAKYHVQTALFPPSCYEKFQQ